jgi:PAS domain S-box-containing protein
MNTNNGPESVFRSAERIIANLPGGVAVFDVNGRCLDVNPAFEALTGYTRVELIQTALPCPGWPELTLQTLHQQSTRGGGTEAHLEFKRKDGVFLPLAVSCSRLVGSEGEAHWLVSVRDVSRECEMERRLRDIQEQLYTAQRLEAVGRLASGVAHDFNNLITVLKSYVTFVLKGLAPDDPAREDVAVIGLTADKAARLVGQLLAFSRRQVLEPEILGLNRVLEELERMLVRILGEDVQLELELADDLGSIRADRARIEQVVMNLVVNARDAMPHGGHLRIRTQNVELDGEYVGAHVGVAPGDYVLLCVSDDGVGMDAATRARIFEPFFSTKAPGSGTGLGLSTVYGIVRQTGGHIWVYSEPGRGTTFRIYLPREAAESASVAPPASTLAAPGQGEMIVLVEDDELLRTAAARTLRQHGYTVLEAADGVEALRLCARAPSGAIRLVITDMVMPQMSGAELARAVSEVLPGVRVVFMSGYQHAELAEQPCLSKPFTPAKLLRFVSSELTHRAW